MRGSGKLGSAKAPIATAITFGEPLNRQWTVEPQTGQKLKVTVLPLSAEREYWVDRPWISVTWARSKRACAPKTLPVRRWQALQWQIEMRTGSPAHVSRSCPQLQDACRFLIPLSPSPQTLKCRVFASGSALSYFVRQELQARREKSTEFDAFSLLSRKNSKCAVLRMRRCQNGRPMPV